MMLLDQLLGELDIGVNTFMGCAVPFPDST